MLEAQQFNYIRYIIDPVEDKLLPVFPKEPGVSKILTGCFLEKML